MNRVRLLSPWTGAGTKLSPYRPKVMVDHPLGPGETCQDVTGQAGASIVPSPNVFTVELVVTDATLAALENDSNYGPGILWSEST